MDLLLVKCKDYNGNKDVLFVMKPTDDRIHTSNWEVIETGKKSGTTFTTDDKTYKVFPDWSVREWRESDTTLERVKYALEKAMGDFIVEIAEAIREQFDLKIDEEHCVGEDFRIGNTPYVIAWSLEIMEP